MKKILRLAIINFSFLISNSLSAQITCDASGNVVLYSNYDGGVLNINVDVNIPNLKIGVVSYEMVTINLSGPFVNNITEVRFAGYTTTTHQHCANTPSITSIVGAPPGTDTLVFMPGSPVQNNNGYHIIICNYSCDTVSSQGGCNTPDQIAAYFQQEFGGLMRYHYTQYGCWSGTYNISDGGNCCISMTTPVPVAVFTSPNHACPGTCMDFTNLSSNASTYQWTFTGGIPATSTDENPAGICYSTPGYYPVTLIATGAGGTDTLTLNNYITVYPFPLPQGILQSGDTLFANAGAVSYQWYYNGSLIAGATDYFYIATMNGNYNVIATDENDCEVEAAIINVIAGFGPFSEDERQQVMVFPNPAESWLNMMGYSLNENAITFSVYNLLGEKIMLPVERESQSARVDVTALNPGIYFLEYSTSDQAFRIRFIKQ